MKPLDQKAVEAAAENSRLLITIEEHAPYGGMGSSVCQAAAAASSVRVITMALPDDHVITGKSGAVLIIMG